MKPQAYPLSWPITQPRTKARQESRFQRPVAQSKNTPGGRSRFHTIADACECLELELDRLGARNVMLSTNLLLKLSGGPRGDQGNPQDPGAAVYFDLAGKPHVLACDKWCRVACNIYAIAKHVESMRGQDRWGVGTREQAFTGYLALEAQTEKKWHEILQVRPDCTREEANKARLSLLSRCHPDIPDNGGGDPTLFAKIGEAFRIACELRTDWK